MKESMFVQAIFQGKVIPSATAIHVVLEEIDGLDLDEKEKSDSIMAFSIISRLFIFSQLAIVDSEAEEAFFGSDGSENEKVSLLRDINKILEAMVKSLGFVNFDLLIQSRIIKGWYLHTRGNYSGGDSQRLRKENGAINHFFKGKKISPHVDSFIKPYEIFYKQQMELQRVLYERICSPLTNLAAIEYNLACDYDFVFMQSVSLVARTDRRMYELLIKYTDLESKLVRVCEKDKNPWLFQCPYCKKRQLLVSRRISAHCIYCGKNYKADWNRKDRPPKPTRASAGWEVAFKHLGCQKCNFQRDLNVKKNCFNCYCEEKNINPESYAR
jgi:hypothetical protein